MSETNALDSVLADSIEKFNGAVDKAVEFSLEQAPLVISEALTWYATKSFIFFLIGLALITLLVMANIYAVKAALKTSKDTYDADIIFVLGGILGLVGNIAGIAIVAGFLNLTWLQIWLAPRVWLLEYASKLVT